jgi:hypothetical protein
MLPSTCATASSRNSSAVLLWVTEKPSRQALCAKPQANQRLVRDSSSLGPTKAFKFKYLRVEPFEQFIQKRKYVKGVTEKTLLWYRNAFKAFDGALDSKATVNARIADLIKRGIKPVSVNTRSVSSTLTTTGFMWNTAMSESACLG